MNLMVAAIHCVRRHAKTLKMSATLKTLDAKISATVILVLLEIAAIVV